MIRAAIFNDTSSTGHFGCLLVMKNLRALLKQRGIEIVWQWPVGKDWRKCMHLLPEPRTIDMIIVNGEGSIHNSVKRWRAKALADVATLAKEHYKKPAFLINSTIFNNEDTLYESMKDFTKIYVRDRASGSELKNHGIDAEYAPDLTFYSPSNQDIKKTREPACIDSVKSSTTKKIKLVCKNNAWQFIYMKKNTPPQLKMHEDIRSYAINWLRFIKIGLFNKTFLSEMDYLLYIASCRFIVSGRYHSVTMALISNVPFIAVSSNTPKIAFLLKDVFSNIDRVLLEADLCTNKSFEKFMQWSNQEKKDLDKFVMNAPAFIDSMFDEIALIARN